MESMNAEVKFAIFMVGHGREPVPNKCAGMVWDDHDDGSLDDMLARCVKEYGQWWTPIAWALADPCNTDPCAVQAASIAAGRTFTLVDGRYIPLGVEKGETADLKPSAALMQWLGEHYPEALARARSYASQSEFHSYMRGLSGVTQERFDSHDHACAAYLDALRLRGWAKSSATAEPKAEKLSADSAMRLRDDKPVSERAFKWATRKTAQDKDEADAAAKREALKTRGTAGNAHPHWGVRAVAVKV